MRPSSSLLSNALIASLLATALSLFVSLPDSFAVPLEKPIDCQIGTDCFIQNYVDLAPGPEYSDASCGPLSYDKHKGTDFRITFEQMKAGVAVKAAAPGVVRGMRDGLGDISINQGGSAAIKDRECGNGLVLVHADGTETQYCHMRKGSVRVKVGQHVNTGQDLGLVGLSGQTEFPHLHFEVRISGNPVCPFTGRVMESGCSSPDKKPQWTDQARKSMPYIGTGALDAGFSTEQPDLKTLFVGGKKAETFTRQSSKLLFWAGFWGVRKDDVITISILTPTGEVWTMDPQVMPRNQAERLAFFGKKYTKPWPVGSYKGEASLKRQGTTIATISRAMSVDASASQ